MITYPGPFQLCGYGCLQIGYEGVFPHMAFLVATSDQRLQDLADVFNRLRIVPTSAGRICLGQTTMANDAARLSFGIGAACHSQIIFIALHLIAFLFARACVFVYSSLGLCYP